MTQIVTVCVISNSSCLKVERDEIKFIQLDQAPPYRTSRAWTLTSSSPACSLLLLPTAVRRILEPVIE